jgi:fluoride exporter
MTAYLVVALGSAIGGALRHGVNVACARAFGTGWPFGTFVVNVSGSFAIGVIASWFAVRGHGARTWLLFLTTGVLGGFTTFSAFSLDVMLLWERGHIDRALLYAVGSVIISLAALVLGVTLTRRLL